MIKIPLNKRKSVWAVDMFHRNIGNPQRYFDELFQNLERERQKLEELPEERRESRGKKIIDNLLTGYGLGLMLKEYEKEKQQGKIIQTKLKIGCVQNG